MYIFLPCPFILCRPNSDHFHLEVWNAKISQHGVQRSDKEGRPDQPQYRAGQADDDLARRDQGPGGAEHGWLQAAIWEVHHLQGAQCAVGEDREAAP